jgi:hypothetical protein
MLAEDQDHAEAAQSAVVKIADEMVECAAYFDVVSVALVNSGARETAEGYVKARKLAVDRANSLKPGIVDTLYNRLIRDLADRIIVANPAKHIEPTLTNISIADISLLRTQYGKLCKEVMNSPGARAEHWMKPPG